MPASRYKIWAVGKPVGRGVMSSLHVGIAAIAKAANATHPFTVANELICNRLAQVLLLPVPPGFIVEHNQKPHFVSLNFNLAGNDLPPADASAVVRDLPELACGVVVFDAWVANPDRHAENLAYLSATRQLSIFDHGHAFLLGADPWRWLEAHKTHLNLGNHCLAKVLEDVRGMGEWLDRVRSVPPYYIEGLVRASVDVGLPANRVDYCIDFLKERQKRLPALIRGAASQFPRVQPDLWQTISFTGE